MYLKLKYLKSQYANSSKLRWSEFSNSGRVKTHGHVGTYLQSQHLGSRSRRIKSSRSAWDTPTWKPITKTKKEVLQFIILNPRGQKSILHGLKSRYQQGYVLSRGNFLFPTSRESWQPPAHGTFLTFGISETASPNFSLTPLLFSFFIYEDPSGYIEPKSPKQSSLKRNNLNPIPLCSTVTCSGPVRTGEWCL